MEKYLDRHPFIRYWYKIFRDTFVGFGRDGGFHLSAGVAYFALFSLFPLLLLAVSFAGYQLSQPQAVDQVAQLLNRMLPGQAEVLIKNISAIARDRGKIGLLGILILAYGSRGLFLSMEFSLNRIWGIKTGRSFLGRYLLSLWLVLSMSVLAVISILISTVFAYLTRIKVPILNISISQLSFYGKVNRWIFSTFLIFFIFLILYRVLPHCKVNMGTILPGALFATFSWKAAEFGYLWYINSVARMAEVYGSLGGIFILLLWFYLSAAVFLLGGKFIVVRMRARNENFLECSEEPET